MLKIFTDLYDEYIEQYSDPRSRDFPLMGSINASLYLITFYLLFVKIIGPRIMQNRPPFKMKEVIIIYNAFQTIFSLLMFIAGTYFNIKRKFNVMCQTQDFNQRDYYTMTSIWLSWIYLISRFVEFADTVFIILKKKNSQVSNLHVIHHAFVPLICWLGVKMVPGGHYTFAGHLNLLVHTFMYFYYMLSTLGPKYKKYIWWKQYLTILQMVQFAIVILHTIWTLLSGCDVPKIFGYLILFQAVLFYKLFFNFYKESFVAGKNENKLVSFFGKYKKKIKEFSEMCIPDQHILMADNTDENYIKTIEETTSKTHKE